jgi:hypothetical protein
MQASISTNPVANELTLTIHDVNWEEIQNAPFYEGERQVRALVGRRSWEFAGHCREGLGHRQQPRFLPAFPYHLYPNR